MIDKNNFFISNLKNVVLIGESEAFSKFIEINRSLKLKTLVVTSSHQAKLFDKKISYKIFDKLDSKFKNFIKKNTKIKDTIFISVGSRFIFKNNINKDFFFNNLVNFHHSRLPLDAGCADISWRIMREDRINMLAVHIVDGGIDSGPIIYSLASLYPRHCQIPIDYHNHRLMKFYDMYKNFIKKVKNGKHFVLRHQPTNIGRYNPRINTEINGFIDWNMDSYDLFNFINAFDDPFKGASTFLNNGNFGKLFIKKVQLHGGDSSNHPNMTGIVSRHDKDWIVVSTKSKHMLLIEEILDIRGNNIIKQIKVGDRFHTPSVKLDKSKEKRIVYNTKGLKK